MNNETAKSFLKLYANARNDDALKEAVEIAWSCIDRCQDKLIINYDDEETMYYACPTCGGFWHSSERKFRDYCSYCGQKLKYPNN